jgi:hypothetical protein
MTDRVDLGGPSYPLTGLVDVARPNSLHMWALGELCEQARKEELNGPATTRLIEVLQQFRNATQSPQKSVLIFFFLQIF